MKIRTEFFLSWKYFKPKRSAVSVITLISVIGVALGVAVLIVVLAVMSGFSDKMREKLLDTTSHAQIRPKYRSMVIDEPERVVKLVKEAGGEALPTVIAPVLLQKNDTFVPKVVIGFDPAQTSNRLRVDEVVFAGEYSLKRGEVIVSYVIARELGLNVGDKILVHSSTNIAKLFRKGRDGKIELTKNSELYLPSEFKITGISNFKKYDFDRDFIFMNLDDADELFSLDWGTATAVYVWTDDPFHMDGFMAKMEKSLKEQAPLYFIESWQEINGRISACLPSRRTCSFSCWFSSYLLRRSALRTR